ncbi:MAG: hypothetical protein C4576_18555 [Desulfobacteraceae bacterium]|nr:MAG: hypothetical protein C4576_18555 [Desulfobacteraceae bacterium]
MAISPKYSSLTRAPGTLRLDAFSKVYLSSPARKLFDGRFALAAPTRIHPDDLETALKLFPYNGISPVFNLQ